MQPGYLGFERLRYFRARENVRLAAHATLREDQSKGKITAMVNSDHVAAYNSTLVL